MTGQTAPSIPDANPPSDGHVMQAANYRNRAAMGPQGGLAADSGDRPPAIKTDIVMVSGVQTRADQVTHQSLA